MGEIYKVDAGFDHRGVIGGRMEFRRGSSTGRNSHESVLDENNGSEGSKEEKEKITREQKISFTQIINSAEYGWFVWNQFSAEDEPNYQNYTFSRIHSCYYIFNTYLYRDKKNSS